MLKSLIRKGYGQIEPNHLSAQQTAQIHAQFKADEDIKSIENGDFLKITSDKENGEVKLNAEGSIDKEWYMAFNEVKLYDNKIQGAKDFRLEKEGAVREELYPRIYKINAGDIFTTNNVFIPKEKEINDLKVGDKFGIESKEAYDGAGFNIGRLVHEAGEEGELVFEVIQVTTMPDGQPAVKLRAYEG